MGNIVLPSVFQYHLSSIIKLSSRLRAERFNWTTICHLYTNTWTETDTVPLEVCLKKTKKHESNFELFLPLLLSLSLSLSLSRLALPLEPFACSREAIRILMRLTLEAGLYWVLKNTHTYTHSPEAGALSALIHTHLHTSILIISITEQKCRNVCATVTTHGFPLFYYYSEIPLIMSSCTSKKHNKNIHMTFKANIVFFIGPALLCTYLVKRKKN